MSIAASSRTTNRINKKRKKAGHHDLDIGKRDKNEVILLVLECVHEQSVVGTTVREIMHRCEINYYYFKQISDYLLQNQLIQQWTVSHDDNELVEQQQETTNRYFITQKGCELRERLIQELGAIGFVPKLGDKRV